MAHDAHNWKPLGDGSLLTEDAAVGLGHIVERKDYLKVLIWLLVLTVVTVGTARMDFGIMNKVVALSIASYKAYLVATIFMHLKFEGKLIIAYAIYPVVLLILFIGSNVGDELDRKNPVPTFGKIVETPLNIPTFHHEH